MPDTDTDPLIRAETLLAADEDLLRKAVDLLCQEFANVVQFRPPGGKSLQVLLRTNHPTLGGHAEGPTEEFMGRLEELLTQRIKSRGYDSLKVRHLASGYHFDLRLLPETIPDPAP